MYYIPAIEVFRVEEFFPPETIAEHTVDGHLRSQIWRLFDERTLITAERLRRRFGTMVINDYRWNGNNYYRGYRPLASLLDIEEFKRTGKITAAWSSFTSQHCLGRAIDAKFKKYFAAEIREDIRRNPNNEEYEFITCIEDGVSWLHFDTRSWNRKESGILWVNA